MPRTENPAQSRRHALLTVGSLLASLPVSGWGQGKKIKVIGLYTVLFEQPWVSTVHAALNAAQRQGQIEYKAFENVISHQYAEALRTHAQNAPNVIFGEAFEVEEAARKVAAQFPKVTFVMGSSGKPQAPNFSVFDNYIHEAAYLTGMLAGGMSKKGRIGLLGGFAIPEVNRLMNAFIDGAKEINPQAQFITGEIRSWLNQPRARRMTLQMVDSGVDAIFAATTAGVISTAAEKGIYAFGNISHPQVEFPKTVVASALWHMEPTVQAVLRDLQQRKPQAHDYGEWSYMHRKGSSLSTLGHFENQIAPTLLQKVRQREKEIMNRQFVVQIKDDIELTIKS